MQQSSTLSRGPALPRVLVKLFVLCAGTSAGIVLGGWIGWAMDRFPGLGLTPETFWHTDPENVWAWCWILGAGVGCATAWAALAWFARRRRGPSSNARP